MNPILTVHQCIWDWSDAGNRMDADNNQKDCAINIFTLCLCSFLHITTQQMIGNVRNAMKICYYIYCMRRPTYSTDWIGNFLRFNKESLKYCLFFFFHIFCLAALCVCRTVIHINHKGCINKVCIEDEWRKLYEHWACACPPHTCCGCAFAYVCAYACAMACIIFAIARACAFVWAILMWVLTMKMSSTWNELCFASKI